MKNHDDLSLGKAFLIMKSLEEWIIFLSVAFQAFWEGQSILFPPSSFEVMALFILMYLNRKQALMS